ncbi:MAG TPA: PQQ-binding-like beta-propeller repeat protein [Pirellulales bacterium]|nr:PQQ-binding-like beta-propeller repeat protein [Pirellulales bacterium]
MAPRPADSELIDVACPACGEVYHLRPDSVGKYLECFNKLCRRRFKIEPIVAGAEAVEASSLEVLNAAPVEMEQPVESVKATAVNAEAADEVPPVQIPPAKLAASPAAIKAPSLLPAPVSTAVAPNSSSISSRPADVPQAEQPDAAPSAAPPHPRSRRRGPPRWAVRLAVIGAAALGVLASYVGVLQFQEWSKSPEEEWKKAQALYQDHKWDHARAALAKYVERFPQAPQAATVPFFLDMCDAGNEVFSPTGDLTRGMAALDRLFRSHRDSPAYHDYAGDLFQALGRLIERSVERARQLSELAELQRAKKAAGDLDRARQAHELLRTVAEAMKDAWVPERVQKLGESVDETARSVKLNLTRIEIVANFRRVPGFPLEGDLGSVYARIEALLHDEPELADDPRILKEQSLAHRSESARVRYRPLPADDAEAAAVGETAAGQTLAIVWQPSDDGGPAAPADDASAVVVTLAQGVLYAFDAAGRPRWARRLGLDVDCLPVRMPASATSGEVLIVRSSAEQSVLALDATTGAERWRFAAPAAMTAPLTLVTIADQGGGKPLLRGLLPTADGRIHVLEPVLGKRLGYYEVGWPLTVGGAYDPVTRRIYFAADFDRVLAIDPAAIDNGKQAACSSVLFARHASGSLRSGPLVVGPYLVLIEASDLDRTRLRAYLLSESGFADADASPLAEQTVSGWSWFAPQASPDRLMFATDQGELGLFGLNLDNQSEAIYRLIEDTAQPPSTLLSGASGTRTLLAHAENQSLWVQAGRALRRLSLNMLQQRVDTVWTGEETPTHVAEIPLHEPQSRRVDRRLLLYLGTMSGDANRCELAAQEAETGTALWRRQVGLHPACDPLLENGRVTVADRGGRIATFDLDRPPSGKTTLVEPADHETLPAGAGGPLMIEADDGRPRLFARTADSSAVAVRPLDPQAAWQVLQPPAEVLGRPCLLAGALAAVCSDGLLHRIAAGGAAADVNDQPFVWSIAAQPSGTAISVTPAGHETVLVCDGRVLRRLQYQARGSVGQWLEIGESYAAEGMLTGRPLVYGEHIFIAGVSGTVEVHDAYDPAHVVHRWSLAGRPTSELFVRAGRVLVVIDQSVIVSLTAAADELADGPNWASERRPGAICGQPPAHGDTLIVTDASGTICGLNMDDGKTVWQTRLAEGQAPAAAAVASAEGFLLVPLVDGTLAVVPLPSPGTQLTEAAE